MRKWADRGQWIPDCEWKKGQEKDWNVEEKALKTWDMMRDSLSCAKAGSNDDHLNRKKMKVVFRYEESAQTTHNDSCVSIFLLYFLDLKERKKEKKKGEVTKIGANFQSVSGNRSHTAVTLVIRHLLKIGAFINCISHPWLLFVTGALPTKDASGMENIKHHHHLHDGQVFSFYPLYQKSSSMKTETAGCNHHHHLSGRNEREADSHSVEHDEHWSSSFSEMDVCKVVAVREPCKKVPSGERVVQSNLPALGLWLKLTFLSWI